MFGGVQEDVQEAAFVVGVVVREVSFDVFDGLCQEEQPISQLVELLAGHDELVLAEAELAGTTSGLVITLATGTPAVQTRAARSGHGLVRAPAPPALCFPRHR
jgi:hypothetical protein